MLGIFKDSGGQDGGDRGGVGEVVTNKARLGDRGQIICMLDLEFYFKCIRMSLEG